jgi:hypothetical protein
MSTTLVVILAVVWVVLLFTLGITSIRKGHWIFFLIGIPIPVFWVIGALSPPTPAAAARH